MPSKKHKCTLGIEPDPVLPEGSGLWARLCHSMGKLFQISELHPETYNWFYSYPDVLAERQRHLYEGGCYINHPYSVFSLCWNNFMIFINLAHMWLAPFRLFYIVVPVKDLQPHYLDGILLLLNFICWIDIFVKFNSGYVEVKRVHIALYRRMICWHYIRTWFFIDLLSSLPLPMCLLYWYPDHPRCVFSSYALPMLRTARIYTAFKNLKPFVKTWTNKSYIWHGGARHFMLFLMTCHWCSCLIYLPPVMCLYWFGEIPPLYTFYLNDGKPKDMLHYSVSERYQKGAGIALSSYVGTCYVVFRTQQHNEFVVHALLTVFTSIYTVYNFVFILKTYMTLHSTVISYSELRNQVEEYMKHKQFPLALKNRVREFYHSRYQGQYFHEENVLNCLSETLRNEITFHTCHKLMEKVSLFKDVPPDVMGSILGSLRAEVYLPNESVVQAGEIGRCMYFVASGTVAVYSLKGAEVCHLEDGAHFGEVALLMKDSKRVATVIAVETTQLYRLDQAEFKQFIMTNDILFERVEALASQRMHETVLLDEEYRSELSRTSEL